MNIPRFRILGLISHRKSASKSLFRPSVLDSLTYVPFESLTVLKSEFLMFRIFGILNFRKVELCAFGLGLSSFCTIFLC